MCKSRQGGYGQRYNAQAAVDADGSPWILASRVTSSASDAHELLPAVEAVTEATEKPKVVLADSGYVNDAALAEFDEQDIDAYVAVRRDESHTQRRCDFRPPRTASAKTIADPRLLDMRDKLQTDAGRKMYAKRKKTVEPVFGIIKHVLGFRQFLHRGQAKVSAERELVCLAYNVKRLCRLKPA